jgi:hypothetical protein
MTINAVAPNSYIQLYIYSPVITYTSNPNNLVTEFPVQFPTDVVIPANTCVNVDMQAVIGLFSPNLMVRVQGIAAVSTLDIINTPLVQAVGCASLSTYDAPTELSIPIRNVTDTDYTILANTTLFTLVANQYQPMRVYVVDVDHMMVNP